MIRILPNEILPAQVGKMLAELDPAMQYSDDDWARATIDLNGNLELCVTIDLGSSERIGRSQIATIAHAIESLPRLHQFVRRHYEKTKTKTLLGIIKSVFAPPPSESHLLWGLEISENELQLQYSCETYNATWEHPFALSQNGEWQIPVYAADCSNPRITMR